MTSVFICYRRKDSDAFAEALRSEFERRLGPTRVFLDTRSIDPGDRFNEEIRQRLERASVVLVVIGTGWIDAERQPGSRALDDLDDPVRAEVRLALGLGKRIIPVLVRRARMPTAERLPDDIRALAQHNEFVIDDPRLDLARLGNYVDGKLSVAVPVVIMGFTASYAFAERTAQRLKGLPYVDAEFAGIATVVRQYYTGVGITLYYGMLLLAALVAMRVRFGWNMEEMLRISLCGAAGVATGFFVATALGVALPKGDLLNATTLALWFLGLAAGTLCGLRWFAPLQPVRFSTIAFASIAIAASAFAGGVLQNLTGNAAATIADVQGATLRGAFWGPVVVAAALLWWWREPSARRLPAADLAGVLLPVLLAMIAADAVAVATTPFPYVVAEKSDLQRVVNDFSAQHNAIFFGLVAGVATWRINRALNSEGRVRPDGAGAAAAARGQPR